MFRTRSCTIINELRYRTGIARCMSVKSLSTAARLYEKKHLERLAVNEYIKVTRIATV